MCACFRVYAGLVDYERKKDNLWYVDHMHASTNARRYKLLVCMTFGVQSVFLLLLRVFVHVSRAFAQV